MDNLKNFQEKIDKRHMASEKVGISIYIGVTVNIKEILHRSIVVLYSTHSDIKLLLVNSVDYKW